MKNKSMNDGVSIAELGRWQNMEAWGREARAIDEKPIDPNAADAIPIPGNWFVKIEIPSRQDDVYGDATSNLGVSPF
jgi:hypothetical protein